MDTVATKNLDIQTNQLGLGFGSVENSDRVHQ